MAVSIISEPDYVLFSECPVLVTTRTSLSNKTFLTVRMSLTANLLVGESTVATDTFKLSIPTTGGDADVTFDISSALSSMFHYVSIDACGGDDSTKRTKGVVNYTYTCWDEYLDDDNSVVSTEESNPTRNDRSRYAIAGGLSDVQRLLWSREGRALDKNMILSSKPDGEVVPVGFHILLPLFLYVGYKGVTASATVTSKQNGTTQTHLATSLYNQTQWLPITFSEVGEATISLPDNEDVKAYIIEAQPRATYFEFINRHGCMESIVCYGKRALSATQESERLSRVPSRAFKPTSQFMKRITSTEQTLSLSTGPLSVEWAKWFANEFFLATEVWMYDEQLGMIPVIIEAEDESVIYSEQEPAVINLSFTAVYNLSGFPTGSHV